MTKIILQQDWIKDRPPTFEDGDDEGDVYINYVESPEGNFSACHWSMVMIGAYWRHTESWVAPTHVSSQEGWITDRPPCHQDADSEGLILTQDENSKTPQYSPWLTAWRQPPWKHSPQWAPAQEGTVVGLMRGEQNGGN